MVNNKFLFNRNNLSVKFDALGIPLPPQKMVKDGILWTEILCRIAFQIQGRDVAS